MTFDAWAQMLSAGDVKKTKPAIERKIEKSKVVAEVGANEENKGPTLEELTRQNASANNNISQMLSDNIAEKDTPDKSDEEKKEPIEEEVFIPEGELTKLHEEPTFDGSKRGGSVFVEVDEKGRMKKTEKIFLFYDKFKITNYISKTATCDVRFNILSNMDRKITQLDVKLVWPDMTTTLSFSDIKPNTQTYYNYALIGNGCYNMDVAPNIIVNRCRIKGYTAAECADKLIWLSK